MGGCVVRIFRVETQRGDIHVEADSEKAAVELLRFIDSSSVVVRLTLADESALRQSLATDEEV